MNSMTKREATEALVNSFRAHLDEVPESVLTDLVDGNKNNLFCDYVALLTAEPKHKKNLPINIRNQLAISRSQLRHFEKLSEEIGFVDSNTAAELMGMTRQALSQNMKAGKVLAYTHKSRKYYPAFQFRKSKVAPQIKRFVEDVKLDISDESDMNVVVSFLCATVDFANPGEPSNQHKRYELLMNPDAFLEFDKLYQVMIRDYNNRYEMGK